MAQVLERWYRCKYCPPQKGVLTESWPAQNGQRKGKTKREWRVDRVERGDLKRGGALPSPHLELQKAPVEANRKKFGAPVLPDSQEFSNFSSQFDFIFLMLILSLVSVRKRISDFQAFAIVFLATVRTWRSSKLFLERW